MTTTPENRNEAHRISQSLPGHHLDENTWKSAFAPGVVLLGGFARSVDCDFLAALSDIAEASPFHNLTTPCGRRVPAAVTNCGSVSWHADQTGYRHISADPEDGRLGPAMPAVFLDLAMRAAGRAGFPNFRPDACLIGRYSPGARLPLHQDLRPQNVEPPVVYVSLGLPAIFLVSDMAQSAQPRRVRLAHGDAVVCDGEERMTFRHVDGGRDGQPSARGPFRHSFTFRFTRGHGRAA
jgi:alkylated DNA repair protein (DNA oxidative demethylase)